MRKQLIPAIFMFCCFSLSAQTGGTLVAQTNADFSRGSAGWQFWTVDSGKGDFAVKDGRGRVTISEPGRYPWSVCLSNPGIRIEQGRKYKVEFEAKSDPPLSADFELRLERDPWSSYSKQRVFELAGKIEAYSYTFVMRLPTDPRAVFQVMCGGQGKGVITFDNLRITDLGLAAAHSTEKATVKIGRSGGTPISPYAFGNCYFNWVDWGKDGRVALKGTEEAVKALRLNLLPGDINMNDDNIAQLFDHAQMDTYIAYCRAVGAEPVMIVPVYGSNVDRGPTSAELAADIVTYMNGTRKYGVRYWCIGFEVDIYDQYYKTNYPVKTASEYAKIFKSYARAMRAANAAAKSGVELKLMTELGWRYSPGNDWLSPLLDECRDDIDIVSIHAYGFAARDLSAEGVLADIEEFPRLVREVRGIVARHARPGTPLAITEANVCYDWDAKLYTPENRRVGPGTFYAAVWDADRMGAALEADLWNFSLWNLAEFDPAVVGEAVFGVILTDPTKNPPALKFTPEYWAQWLVDNNFSGTTVVPSGAPDGVSVYASYDPKKAATAVLVINKDAAARTLTLAVDDLRPRTIECAPMSINIVSIPDGTADSYRLIEYTKVMADAGLPPRTAR